MLIENDVLRMGILIMTIVLFMANRMRGELVAVIAFATTIASLTNSLVLTVGGYKFMHFVKVDVPLQIIMFIVMMIAILKDEPC